MCRAYSRWLSVLLGMLEVVGRRGEELLGGSAPLSIHKRTALLSWEARELLSGNQLRLTWVPPPLVNDLTLN